MGHVLAVFEAPLLLLLRLQVCHLLDLPVDQAGRVVAPARKPAVFAPFHVVLAPDPRGGGGLNVIVVVGPVTAGIGVVGGHGDSGAPPTLRAMPLRILLGRFQGHGGEHFLGLRERELARVGVQNFVVDVFLV